MYSPQNDPAGDSEVTLVNPLPDSSLIFKSASVLDNILSFEGWPHFKIAISDDTVTGSRTEISNPHSKEILVKIQRRNLFSDEITFSRHFDGKTLKIGKDWLKEVKGENKQLRWVFETGVGTFAWRLDPETQFAVCPDHDLKHPIAWLELNERKKPKALILRSGTEDFWDMVVAGWVILQQRSTGEKPASSGVEGWNLLLFDGSLKAVIQRTS